MDVKKDEIVFAAHLVFLLWGELKGVNWQRSEVHEKECVLSDAMYVSVQGSGGSGSIRSVEAPLVAQLMQMPLFHPQIVPMVENKLAAVKHSNAVILNQSF